MSSSVEAGLAARARGCLLGQLAGDSLGSLVEFQSAEDIRRRYPGGLRLLADGGTWGTIAGQPTDDSELALMLGRSIAKAGRYDPGGAARAYAYWYESGPFDIGGTTRQALSAALVAARHGDAPPAVAGAARAAANRGSQANGALMRVSPLGIYAYDRPAADSAALARMDASLTHPHPICADANATFVVAIAASIRTGEGAEAVYRYVMEWARGRDGDGIGTSSPGGAHMNASGPRVRREVLDCLEGAAKGPPVDFQTHQGWVLVALQNAFWQMLTAPNLEIGVSDTVMSGGDTDTNAAIAGALLGAVHGAGAVPEQWVQAILACRPERGRPGVKQPRPEAFWPVDALELADRLVSVGTAPGNRERGTTNGEQ